MTASQVLVEKRQAPWSVPAPDPAMDFRAVGQPVPQERGSEPIPSNRQADNWSPALVAAAIGKPCKAEVWSSWRKSSGPWR